MTPADSQNIALLGSTGSIGKNTLDVVRCLPSRFNIVGLSANRNTELLIQQAVEFKPNWIVITDKESFDRSKFDQLSDVEVFCGHDSLQKQVSLPEVDTVVAAIVGSAGLRSSWAAIEAGKKLALANKETLVVAGSMAMELAQRTGAKILPVDSEHSAIFQANLAGKMNEIKRTILTASGGPFRDLSRQKLADVTVKQALDHPTWEMGPKITVDSATMMNKALEIIEAKWLFDLEPDAIDVVIHPQSIVHSMVEFVDGSILAQLSPPDMRLPIQYALTYPERTTGPARRLDITRAMELSFFPRDDERFPALKLGIEVAAKGGTSGAVLNAANEAAVESFLNGKLAFNEIVPACRTVLENHNFDPNPALGDLIKLDRWAREEFDKWMFA